jgi:hypothetical protein
MTVHSAALPARPIYSLQSMPSAAAVADIKQLSQPPTQNQQSQVQVPAATPSAAPSEKLASLSAQQNFLLKVHSSAVSRPAFFAAHCSVT